MKNDKSEVRSKVIEITDNTIKYKKWENLDGPIYGIHKSEVFMIIYANGTREIINKKISNTAETTSHISVSKENIINQERNALIPDLVLDTSINYKDLKVKYKPSRINLGLQTPFSIGSDQEVRILKNFLNLGVAYYYSFPADESILQSQFGFIYTSLYAPVNRLLKKYQNQDKGLFVFGHLGYGASYTRVEDYLGNINSYSTSGFTWRIGADYFFTPGLGVSVSSYELKSFYAGFTFTLF